MYNGQSIMVGSLPQEDVDPKKIQSGRHLWITIPLITGAVIAQALASYGIPCFISVYSE